MLELVTAWWERKLIDAGVDTVVGIDIIEEAAMALERDRPGIYSEYFVEDLTSLPSEC